MRAPCSKCGGDAPHYYRKAHGVWGYASYCVLCYREDQKCKNERYWAKHRERANARSRELRRGNPRYLAIARKTYWKNRTKILERKKVAYVPVTIDKRRKFSLIGTIRDGVW